MLGDARTMGPTGTSMQGTPQEAGSHQAKGQVLEFSQKLPGNKGQHWRLPGAAQLAARSTEQLGHGCCMPSTACCTLGGGVVPGHRSWHQRRSAPRHCRGVLQGAQAIHTVDRNLLI